MTRKRKSRHERLFAMDAEVLIRAALQYRSAALRAKIHLVAFNPSYCAIHETTEALDRMLEVISGRRLDYRASDLGLLGEGEHGPKNISARLLIGLIRSATYRR